MIDKAVIAAAGKGTRMLDLAKDRPKHIIPVAGKPFLFYLLSNLQSAGFEEFNLIIGHHKQKMVDFARDFSGQFNIKLIDQFDIIGQDRYGTACAIEAASDAVGSDEFIAVYGDNLYSVNDIKALIKHDGYQYVAGYKHDEPERYGILIEDGGMLKEILEKPTKELAADNHINTGIYKFTPEIFSAIKTVGKSKRGEYELTDAISRLAREGKVKVVGINDYWYDFGRPEDIEVMNKFIQSKRP